MDQRIVEILAPAYQPCQGFAEVCHEMRWHPNAGHIPRGFLGAKGSLSEVELVLVFAEPGDPLPNETHTGMDSALRAAEYYHGLKRDQFHKNVRYILDLCWPNLTFAEQLSKVWMTESVLCSAPVESGSVRSAVERVCGQRYLLKQLHLFPDAVVVALGVKAQNRMRAIGFDRFISASAVAPPEGNKPHAKQSWNAIACEVARRRADAPHVRTGKKMDEVSAEIARPPKSIAQTNAAASKSFGELSGPYRVVDASRLQATEENDPGKWSIWKHIWDCRSFEELKRRSPREALTRTNRCITWQSEARWALKCGWIEKVDRV